MIAPIKLQSLVDTQPSAGAYYFPLSQQPSRLLTFAIHTGVDPMLASAGVRTAIRSLDPELAVFDLQPMDRWTTKSIASRRLAMLLSLTFSSVALFLAAVGIYGLLAYLVAYRRKEVAIRMALGATGPAVFRLIVREGLSATALGVVGGATVIAVFRRLLQSQLFGIAATDPVVLIVVTAALAAVAVLACVVPARRASRIDPVAALAE